MILVKLWNKSIIYNEKSPYVSSSIFLFPILYKISLGVDVKLLKHFFNYHRMALTVRKRTS